MFVERVSFSSQANFLAAGAVFDHDILGSLHSKMSMVDFRMHDLLHVTPFLPQESFY